MFASPYLLRFLLALAVGCTTVSGYALQKPTYSLDLRFDGDGVSLDEPSRKQIQLALDRVKKRDWCPFEAAFVEVYESDGVPEKSRPQVLARLENVRRFLLTSGVPEKALFGGVKPAAAPDRLTSKAGALELLGGVWPRPCPYSISPAGFRLPPN
jgi:hypothetical protein